MYCVVDLADRSVFFILLYILGALIFLIGFPMLVYKLVSTGLLFLSCSLVNAIFGEMCSSMCLLVLLLFRWLLGLALFIGLVYKYLIKVWGWEISVKRGDTISTLLKWVDGFEVFSDLLLKGFIYFCSGWLLVCLVEKIFCFVKKIFR